MASTYLTSGNLSSAGNQKKWTISFWVKRAKLGVTQGILDYSVNSTNYYNFTFKSTDGLTMFNNDGGTVSYELEPSMKFRDTSGWYHIVHQYDSEQATESNRAKLWVNGVQQSSWTNENYPSQGANTKIPNSGYPINIGRQYRANTNVQYFDGSLSHFHFCDGYAYSASDFGQTDANGVWKIKTSPSVTYGTNGFFILKDGNSVTDQSGNGNNFTVGGGTLTNTEDSPSNVFNTMTDLAKSSSVNLANGSCTTIGNSNSSSGRCRSNWNLPNSGKWYFEYKMIADNQGNTYPNSGIKYNAEIFYNPENSDSTADIFVYGTYSGELIHVNNGTHITAGAPATSGDIFGWCVDMDNGAIYIHQNGTYINSGNPESGASKTGAIYSFTPSDYPNMCVVSNEYGNSETQYNFGNGYFSATAVASAGTNASGIGIFEYDVPTGYTALSTKGLNL